MIDHGLIAICSLMLVPVSILMMPSRLFAAEPYRKERRELRRILIDKVVADHITINDAVKRLREYDDNLATYKSKLRRVRRVLK